jgi:predicted lysophospholipase L1 biosynthesis ABC-type transport system permease subunit
VGSSITAFAPDVTLAGQQVDATGKLTPGQRVTIPVAVRHEEAGGTSRYSVELPAASAGLVVLKAVTDDGNDGGGRGEDASSTVSERRARFRGID